MLEKGECLQNQAFFIMVIQLSVHIWFPTIKWLHVKYDLGSWINIFFIEKKEISPCLKVLFDLLIFKVIYVYIYMCVYIYIYIYIYTHQGYSRNKKLAKGSTVYGFFSRKSIVIASFMSQKTISMTFFTKCCAQKVFFIRECVVTLWTVFLTHTCCGKFMFSPFVNISWIKHASP